MNGEMEDGSWEIEDRKSEVGRLRARSGVPEVDGDQRSEVSRRLVPLDRYPARSRSRGIAQLEIGKEDSCSLSGNGLRRNQRSVRPLHDVGSI